MLLAHTTSPQYSIAFAGFDESTLGVLTRLERFEYDALISSDGKRDWLAGRRAAKQVVAEASGFAHIADIELVARSHAAPHCLVRVETGWSELPVSVSIAHRDGWAIAAACGLGMRVGVDLERPQAVAAEHARYFVSSRETRAAELLSPSLLWVLKEAAWKALALDDGFAFGDLAMCVARNGAVCGVFVRDAWLPAKARTWVLPNGLIAAALCVTQDVQ